jgi:microcystin-dependent protein
VSVDPAAAAVVDTSTAAPDPVGVASDAPVTQLADTLIDTTTSDSGPDTRPSDGAVLRYGKITAVGSGVNASKVQVDAFGTAWLSYDAAYLPAVGDLVYLLQQGPVAHVGGKLGGSPTGPPVGVIHAFAGATAPTGWLLCDGAAVSRTTYATLFGLCGTTYGSGDGSTTFNIPNLTDRIPTGYGTKFPRGEAAGSETFTLTTSNMPSHTHGSGGTHDHTGQSHDHVGTAMGTHDHTGTSHSHTIGHDHTVSPHTHSYTGGGSQGATGGSGIVVADNTAGTTGSTTVNVVTYSGSSSSATTGVTAASAGTPNVGSATAGVNATDPGPTAAAGSGTSVNNMPPYLATSWIVRALP